MKDLSNLSYAEGSRHVRKRKGRGVASGNGKTAGRGHNGYMSRGGSKHRVAFEGGQLPLQRRLPKFGFTNPNRVEYQGVNLDRLQELVDNKKIKTKVDKQTWVDNGLAKKKDLVKILGRGELKAKLDITAHAFSASAKAAIEKAGGSATLSEK